jgi:3-oxoacyl-[acyl-carrier-protein] synthase III
VPEEKVVINIEKFGNTTAATIPLALSDAVDAGRLERGDTLLMVSVGAGFTVGTLLLKWGLKTEAATRTGVRNSSASEL